MKFIIQRDHILKSLSQLSGALGGRQSLPILSNILLKVEAGRLLMIATDLELELIAAVPLEQAHQEGAVTVPSRKFSDICRGLPEHSELHFSLEGERAILRAGRSRFSLSTLPAQDFPNIEDWQSVSSFSLTQGQLKQLIDSTAFSMANQDVRYFLNGLFIDIEGDQLRAVATDGHRLALSSVTLAEPVAFESIIVPRKGIVELTRLLDQPDAQVTLEVGQANIRVNVNQFTFTSKLIDGRFPDYRRVMPKAANNTLQVDCESFRQALSRAAILSNEKFRGVRINLAGNLLTVSSRNPEQEEAEEQLDVVYQGDAIEIGFNVNYLIEVLNHLKCDQVRIFLSDGAGSVLIENADLPDAQYVVMPIRL